MKTKTKKPSQLTEMLREMADDMKDVGVMDQETYEKINGLLNGEAQADLGVAREQVKDKKPGKYRKP